MSNFKKYDSFLYNLKYSLVVRVKELTCLDSAKDIEMIDNLKETLVEMDYLEEKYDQLFNICFGQYSSIEDFEKAKKEFIEENE